MKVIAYTVLPASFVITCVLIFGSVLENRIYDLESANVKVDYGNLQPPPENDKWEYLTYMEETWLFLSTHERSRDTQRKECLRLQSTFRDGNIEGYQDLILLNGLAELETSLQSLVLDILYKINITSVWEGTAAAGNPYNWDDKCDLFKFNRDKKEFEPFGMPCRENHTAVCAFREVKKEPWEMME